MFAYVFYTHTHTHTIFSFQTNSVLSKWSSHLYWYYCKGKLISLFCGLITKKYYPEGYFLLHMRPRIVYTPIFPPLCLKIDSACLQKRINCNIHRLYSLHACSLFNPEERCSVFFWNFKTVSEDRRKISVVKSCRPNCYNKIIYLCIWIFLRTDTSNYILRWHRCHFFSIILNKL